MTKPTPEPTPRNDNFADQLIAAQRVEPTLRQRYEQEIQTMLEQPLTTTRKVSFTASIVICTIMATALTIAAVSSHRAPIGVRIGLGLGAVYALGWLVSFIIKPDPTRLAPSPPFDAESARFQQLVEALTARLHEH